MLLNNTEQLMEELNTFKLLQESSNESQHYIKRSNDLKSILIYVENMSEIVSLFRKQGFVIEIDTTINYAIEHFKNLYINWENDKTSIIDKNDFFRRVQWSVMENELVSMIQKQWSEYIDDKKPDINDETLDLFEQIPDFSITVNNLKEKLEVLNEQKKCLPVNDDSFLLIISTSSEMTNMLKQLESKSIPDPVIRFLKKAVDGIDLSEITTEILDWLKDNNLIHLCQVKFRK